MSEDTEREIKTLYRRLLRKFHPDTTTSTERKTEYGELTKIIIDAYQRGDFESLERIEKMGVNYRPLPSPPEISAEVYPSTTRSVRRRVRDSIWWAFLNPYGLSVALRDWSYNGRSYNALALAGGVGWTWLALKIWIGIGGLSRWLEQAGFSHDGPVGFALIVLRGILILGAFRVVVPVAVIAMRCGLVLVVGLVACWIASAILGVVHPYLSVLAKLVFAAFAVSLAWRYLDESEEG